MNCPKCGLKSRVVDSRSVGKFVYRKRICTNCNFKFFTKEELSSEASIELSRYHHNRKKGKSEV